MIKTCPLHRQMNIPFDSSNNPVCGKNDLFAVAIVFKMMLSKTDFNRFYFSLKKIIEDLEKQLKVIGISSVLEKMGFPSNWTEIKRI